MGRDRASQIADSTARYGFVCEQGWDAMLESRIARDGEEFAVRSLWRRLVDRRVFFFVLWFVGKHQGDSADLPSPPEPNAKGHRRFEANLL